MEKYIEAIIEIVLDHVTCLHQEIEEYPRGPKQADVTYGIDNEQEVIKKCLLLKPEAYHVVDKEEFIEKRARAMHDEVFRSSVVCKYQCNIMGRFRIQVRKTLEEA